MDGHHGVTGMNRPQSSSAGVAGAGTEAHGAVTRDRSRRRVGRPTVHGLYQLKRAVRELGGRVLDRRTGVGRALAEWRDALVADLGGADAVSTQQLALVDLAVR